MKASFIKGLIALVVGPSYRQEQRAHRNAIIDIIGKEKEIKRDKNYLPKGSGK